MSLISAQSRNRTPEYYHREFENDYNTGTSEESWASLGKRYSLVALPFISFYKPLGFPLTLVSGGLRTWSCASHLPKSFQTSDIRLISYHLFQTSIAGISLVGTFFAHPLGMVMATGHDLIIEVENLQRHLRENNIEKAIESCLNIVNNSLYLALLIRGGLELAVASLAMQVLMSLYHSQAEFKKGHSLEGGAHLLMGMVRCNQLRGQIKLLKMKWEIDALIKQGNLSKSSNGNMLNGKPSAQELIAVTDKYKNYSFASFSNHQNAIYPSVLKACMAADKEAITIFLKHGLDLNKPITLDTGFGPQQVYLLTHSLAFWGNLSFGLGNVDKADIFSFLIANGADINKCNLGLQAAINELRFTGQAGIDALKLAIQKGASLKGALNYVLNRDWNFYGSSSGYKDKVVELLLASGAKLD